MTRSMIDLTVPQIEALLSAALSVNACDDDELEAYGIKDRAVLDRATRELVKALR